MAADGENGGTGGKHVGPIRVAKMGPKNVIRR
jgi:hypothetical protein